MTNSQPPAPELGERAPVPEGLLSELMSGANSQLEDTDRLVHGLWNTSITWRQPVHTLYMPADKLFGQIEGDDDRAIEEYVNRARSQATATLSGAGLGEFDALFDGLRELAKLQGLNEEASSEAARLTERKLSSQLVEDLRIDLEDGFTQRSIPMVERDADEDAYSLRAADALAGWAMSDRDDNGDLPAFAGIRFKSFDPLTRERGIRTLVLVLTRLHERGALRSLYAPHEGRERALRLTFPKVQSHHQVEALVQILEKLENRFELGDGVQIRFEVQVETPQSIVGRDGETEATRIINAAQGRCLALHYGTYDYSAFLGVDAAYQSMEHPVADFAKDTLQVACSAVGVELSDGSTNRIPVGNQSSVRDAWILHFRLVQRHLKRGIRQGWDLHPAQLITRHLATIAYFRDQWEPSATRLRDYVAGDESRWMDEPATAKAMSSFLRRAFQAGAVTDAELERFSLQLDMLEQLQLTGRLSSN